MAFQKRYRPVVAVCCLAVALTAAACSSSSGTPSSSGSKSASTNMNHTLTLAIQVEPISLDPCDTQAANGVGVIRGNVTQSLTDVDPTSGKVIPYLALSWAQTNPTTWTFQLRPNVKFQDGTPFTAAAAAMAINRTENVKLGCQNIQQFPTPVVATATGTLTLRVVTKQADPILPLRIGYVDITSMKTPLTTKTSDPIGTGPYQIASRTVGQSLKLTRFDGYWGPKPQAASVVYVYRSEDSVRAATAKTGEAGIAVPIGVQDATTDDRTRTYTQDRVFFLRLETNKAPLNNLDVRQAIAYAINKNQVVSALMGKGGAPTDQMLAPSVNGYIPGYKGPTYDQNKAKSLIASAKTAGVDVSQPIQMISRSDLFPGADDVMQAIIQELNQIGLNVKLKDLDDNAYLSQLLAPNNPAQPVNIMPVTHDNESGDASFSLPKYLSSTGAVSTVRDPKVDSLLSQAELAEGTQRASLFQQAAQTEYTTDFAIEPIAEQFSLLLLGPGVEYKPNGLTGIELKASDVTFTN